MFSSVAQPTRRMAPTRGPLPSAALVPPRASISGDWQAGPRRRSLRARSSPAVWPWLVAHVVSRPYPRHAPSLPEDSGAVLPHHPLSCATSSARFGRHFPPCSRSRVVWGGREPRYPNPLDPRCHLHQSLCAEFRHGREIVGETGVHRKLAGGRLVATAGHDRGFVWAKPCSDVVLPPPRAYR
jgi:hypothetical protein